MYKNLIMTLFWQAELCALSQWLAIRSSRFTLVKINNLICPIQKILLKSSKTHYKMKKNAACWDGADSLQVKPVGAGGQTLQN